MNYKVKNFKREAGLDLQQDIKEWIESREHITISNINTWTNEDNSYCTIVYIEKEYTL